MCLGPVQPPNPDKPEQKMSRARRRDAKVFEQMDPNMQAMENLIHSGREAGRILKYVVDADRQKKFLTVKRNDLCPYGSSGKYKNCRGAPI